MKKEKTYTLTESEICFILNGILEKYFILWPRNPRYKAQELFLKDAEHIRKYQK